MLHTLRSRAQEEKGFTLIELLIVIVILGILAAIVVFAVQNLTGQSATAACGSDFKTVETVTEAYKAQLLVYPGNALAAGYTANPSATGTTASISQGSSAHSDALGAVWDRGSHLGGRRIALDPSSAKAARRQRPQAIVQQLEEHRSGIPRLS